MTTYEIVKLDQDSITMEKASTLWNSSIEVNGNYASNYPYTIIDEGSVQHLLNFTAKHSLNHTEVILAPCDEILKSFFAEEFQTMLNILYPTILLVAAIGNVIVCFIVCSSSRMQTVTNYFITNLGECAGSCCGKSSALDN